MKIVPVQDKKDLDVAAQFDVKAARATVHRSQSQAISQMNTKFTKLASSIGKSLVSHVSRNEQDAEFETAFERAQLLLMYLNVKPVAKPSADPADVDSAWMELAKIPDDEWNDKDRTFALVMTHD